LEETNATHIITSHARVPMNLFETTDYVICNKCKEHKPKLHFTKDTKYKDGVRKTCKACRNKASRDLYCTSSEDKFTQAKRIKYHTTEEGRLGYTFRSAKQRAKKNGTLFTIVKKDLEVLYANQNKRCSLSGRKFVFELPTSAGITKDSISLDRIDSSKGYTVDNIQLVTSQVNYAKSYFTQSEFINMCLAVTENKSKLCNEPY